MRLFNSSYLPFLDAAGIPPDEMKALGIGLRSAGPAAPGGTAFRQKAVQPQVENLCHPEAARPAQRPGAAGQLTQVDCPTCGQHLRVPAGADCRVGRTGRCPACQTLFPIPAASAARRAEVA